MRVTTKLTFSMITGEVLEHSYYGYDGPVDLLCGATSMQKQIGGSQQSFFNTMTQQAQSVFGMASSVFQDLVSAFSPIVAKGPNQRGFSDEQRAALNTQATEGTGQMYDKASKSVNAGLAARGGGNALIPSGADEQLRQEVATSAAQEESQQKLGIVNADYSTGRQNFFQAAQGLAAAPGVFNTSVEMANAATNSGNAAANSANQIAQEDNSWVGAVTGALGGIAGAAVTGGFGMMKPKAPSGPPGMGGAAWGSADFENMYGS